VQCKFLGNIAQKRKGPQKGKDHGIKSTRERRSTAAKWKDALSGKLQREGINQISNNPYNQGNHPPAPMKGPENTTTCKSSRKWLSQTLKEEMNQTIKPQ
jgi:hypothetical protein